MKLTLVRPNYHEGVVVPEGGTIETTEQHGRELVKKGYAREVADDDAKAKAAAEAKEKAEADAKAQAEVKAREKADEEAKAKAAAEAKEKAKK